MARRLPKSFTSTPEEDEFFVKEKAASAAPLEEEEEAPAPAESTEEAAPEEEVTASESEEEAPAEEAEAESSEDADEDRPSRTVPIGALHEEREKRRQLQAKIEQMEVTFQKMMERVAQGQQPPAPAPAAAPEPTIPSYEEDPVAHLKARLDQLSQITGSTTQQIQQQTAMTKFVDALGTLENQMRAVTPDYDDAINFAKQSRYAELTALGYAPEATAEMMRQEILGTAAYCMQQGRNPVEAFYNYAKVRGWRGPNGTPKPTLAPTTTTAKKLATVAKAQSTSRALPRGGSAPPTARTLEDLATMEDADFDKFFDSVMRKT